MYRNIAPSKIVQPIVTQITPLISIKQRISPIINNEIPISITGIQQNVKLAIEKIKKNSIR